MSSPVTSVRVPQHLTMIVDIYTDAEIATQMANVPHAHPVRASDESMYFAIEHSGRSHYLPSIIYSYSLTVKSSSKCSNSHALGTGDESMVMNGPFISKSLSHHLS